MTVASPTYFETAQVRYEIARAHAAQAMARVQAYNREHGYPVPEELSDAWMKAGRTAGARFTELVNVAMPGFETICPEGIPVTVVDTTYNAVVVSQDGGPVIREWHREADGPADGEAIYYEVYTEGGRHAHGYVDSVSRKIVQTG